MLHMISPAAAVRWNQFEAQKLHLAHDGERLHPRRTLVYCCQRQGNTWTFLLVDEVHGIIRCEQGDATVLAVALKNIMD